MQLSDSNPRLWEIPGHPLSVELHEPVLEALRVAARMQFKRRTPFSVNERGAILGCRPGSRIVLTGSVPVGAILSFDERNSVVGWYALRLAKDISLTREDVEYMLRPHADPAEIALIFRPVGEEAVRFGIFFREEDGYIRSVSSYREMLVAASDATAEERQIPVPEPAPVSRQIPVRQTAPAFRQARQFQATRNPAGYRQLPGPRTATGYRQLSAGPQTAPISRQVAAPQTALGPLNSSSPAVAQYYADVPPRRPEMRPAAPAPAPIPPKRWGSMALASIVMAILILIVFIEVHAMNTAPAHAAAAAQPIAPAVGPVVAPVPIQPPPAPAPRQVTADPAVVKKLEILDAQLKAERDHNRRMEHLLEELRDRSEPPAEKAQGPDKTDALVKPDAPAKADAPAKTEPIEKKEIVPNEP